MRTLGSSSLSPHPGEGPENLVTTAAASLRLRLPSLLIPVPSCPFARTANGSHPPSSVLTPSQFRQRGPRWFWTFVLPAPSVHVRTLAASHLRSQLAFDTRPEDTRGLAEEVASFWHVTLTYAAEPVLRARPLKAWSLASGGIPGDRSGRRPSGLPHTAAFHLDSRDSSVHPSWRSSGLQPFSAQQYKLCVLSVHCF